MHQRISKKIFIYLFIFLILVTINNINLSNYNPPKIQDLEVFGLNNLEKKQFNIDIKDFENDNIFSIDKKEISKKVYKNKIVEKFFIFKIYPSSLEVQIEKTNFLAITKKDNLNYYIGSNGNLIKTDYFQSNLPIVHGNIDTIEFMRFKKIIDNSTFDFNVIKNFYYSNSKRWDLETKDGLMVKLPLKQIESSLDILTKLSKNNEFKDIKIIDLRQNNQIIVYE